MPSVVFRTTPKLEVIPNAVQLFVIDTLDEQLVVFGDPNPVELVPDVDPNLLGLSKTNPVVKIVTSAGVLGFISGKQLSNASEARSIGGVIARVFSQFEHLQIFAGSVVSSHLIAEGIALGLYSFDTYKSSPKLSKLKNVTFVTNEKFAPSELKRIEILKTAVHAVRDLVNTPANDIYPQQVAKWAEAQSAKTTGVAVEIWDEKRLAKEKCGGILAVGQGSVRPPRLVKLSWGPKSAKFKLALVGKGITFDTGGLSLKPAASMVGMKYDMTGAATVLNAVLAIAKLKLPIQVTAYAALAENMPSGSATRPNDIIRARNGKTIEIMNTDAEGRVVLADALSLASEAKPDLIVDVATLTGAATVALGNRYAGLMGADLAVQAVSDAAASVDELVWHMPLPEELRSVLDSPIADIANAKIGHTAGGMLIGGLFLKEFVAEAKPGLQIPWAHLDIAGPANNDKEPYGHIPKGATGALVRTLVALAEQLSA